MEKLKISIPLILPKVPNEKDQCVDRLIQQLEGQAGLEKIHIVSTEQDNGEPQLCFHYQPEVISLEHIKQLAKQTGASLTRKYGHLLAEVTGVRHTRHARKLERALQDTPGVVQASVSAGGLVRIEFDTQQIGEALLREQIKREGLQLTQVLADAEAAAYSAKQQLPTAMAQPEPVKDTHQHTHGDGHNHGGWFGENTELIFSLICGALLGFGFLLTFIAAIPMWVSLALYVGAYFFGGFYTAKEAYTAVRHGGFEIDFLMLVAALGAAILGEWAEGALLLFLFSLGHALEHYAMGKAQKSIAALADLAPKTALLKRNGTTSEVGIEELRIGDIIVVKPNSKISADGVVVSGSSSVNQAPITGESVPVDKLPVEDATLDYAKVTEIKPENRVFSGTINGNHLLEVKVIKAAKDSTLSRLITLVNEAQTQKSPTQRFTDKFERYFVPAVLLLVLLLNFAFLVINETFAESFYRAMSVLVAASPCALAISTPSAVLSGVARAARGGVLIKGGRPLEDLGELTALAFDKTGTLTEGKPKLTQVIPLSGVTEQALLQAAIAVETLSDHPLAKAVVRDGKTKLGEVSVPEAKDLEAVLGKGITATVGPDQIYIGNLELYDSLDGLPPSDEIRQKVKAVEAAGNTTMLLRRNDQYIGILALMDTPRAAAAVTLRRLKSLGIKRMIMLTGDNQMVANAVAQEIGLTDAWGSLLPEEKVAAIKKLKAEESKVAMIGDGVNDAPAMAASTVGIAMGAAGSDVALETADIALMADRLETLPFAIGLSRKAKAIIKQNLWISLGMVAILVPLTILGIAGLGPAVIAHEGSTLVVVANALRLLAYKE